MRKCLYSDPDSDSSMVLASPLLQALGSLLVSSMRGRAGSLISFNFDDLIETYLRLLGFVVRSEPIAPYWAVNADMQVFHPHGLLPRDTSKPVTKIVFTSADFDEVIGRDDNAWNQSMRSVIGGTMPLFIGLSGEDQRLRSLLAAVKSRHPAIERDGGKYWGVRPTLRTDAEADVAEWTGHGIAPRYLDSYVDFPAWILSICQKAAAYSSISRNV